MKRWIPQGQGGTDSFSSLLFQGSVSSRSALQDLPVQQVSGTCREWSSAMQVSVKMSRVFTQENERWGQAGLEHGTNIRCPTTIRGSLWMEAALQQAWSEVWAGKRWRKLVNGWSCHCASVSGGSQPLQGPQGEAVELDINPHFLDLEEMRSHVLLGANHVSTRNCATQSHF